MKIPLLLLSVGLLVYGTIASAGRTEVHARTPPLQISPLLPTPTPSITEFSPSSTALTTTIPASLDSLQVVYRRDQQLWHWQQGAARPLLSLAGVGNFKLSPDGKWLAFERDGNLWLVRTNGTDERLLVEHTALGPFAPDESSSHVLLEQWLPNSTHLLFRVMSSISNFSQDTHLYLADVEQGQWRELSVLAGGTEVLPTPDGATLALVSQAELRLIDLDGHNLGTVFRYTPGAFTHQQRPPVRWAADGLSLVTVEPFTGLNVWQIALDGTEPTLLAEVEPQIASPYNYSLSPTGRYLVYAGIGAPDMAIPPGETHFVELQTGRAWLYYAEVGSFGSWLPESDRFSFWVEREDDLYLGSVQNSLLMPLRKTTPLSLVWVDEEYFLYSTAAQALRLGSMGSTDSLIDEGVWGFTFVR